MDIQWLASFCLGQKAEKIIFGKRQSESKSRTGHPFRGSSENKGTHLFSEPENQSSCANMKFGTASGWFASRKKNFLECVHQNLSRRRIIIWSINRMTGADEF